MSARPEIQTRTVRATHLPLVEGTVERLTKRARKLSATPPSFREVRRFEQQERDQEGRPIKWSDGTPLMAEWVEVEITNAVVKLAGWHVLARIEHTEHGVIVKGSDDPAIAALTEARCDHCRKARNRIYTYVVEKDGRRLQVGSGCLKDFAGHDVTNFGLPNLWTDGEEWDEWGGGGEYPMDLLRFLTLVAVCTREHGFRSRKEHGRGYATADQAMSAYHAGGREAVRVREAVNDGDVRLARTALKWARTLESPDSGYLTSLQTIARSGYLYIDNAGLAGSLLVAYERAQGHARRAKDAKARAARSRHVGTVKERLRGLHVRYVMTRWIESYWGSKSLEKFVDADGNVYVWWNTGDPLFTACGEVINPEGAGRPWVVLDGTVKTHDEFDGTAQTVLTRCRVHHTFGLVENGPVQKAAAERAWKVKDLRRQYRSGRWYADDPNNLKAYREAVLANAAKAGISPEEITKEDAA